MYVKTKNGEVLESASLGEIKQENPNVSFPIKDKFDLNGFAYHKIAPTRNPTTDSDLYKKDGVEFVEGQYREKWVLETDQDKIDEHAASVWQRRMEATDIKIPRYAEDIIDALPGDVRAKINSTTLQKYNAKKALRAEMPVGKGK